ncbi:class I SAM-dependent methyltransferase [Jannaschia seohaensis]|uniref:Methyltransferase domain-containing protein n=1 Tax=Jannaschia seohaensis TaxID=475081 RepID=A0A2Y9ANR8_9RHOB|nr:class I SAM-dependent methyltransferase [Jannaschia seohaensis]PWJ19129.1 methyltransferase family protein [Jannaschia seohaensis]SSA45775.1 Methyltransferase domain-containing protein [Jannaschia seohaensis]
MSDAKTLEVYDAQAAAYAAAFDAELPRDLEAFAALLPEGGRVLDLGCGPGGMAGWLAGQGFAVDAWDASPEMVALAGRHAGVTTRLAVFEDLEAEGVYDGIWASFSLLHARRSELPDLIGRMARALRPGGVAYVGMKLGSGEGRDALGRHYAYVSEAELTGWLEVAGLTLVQVRTGRAKGLAGTDDPFVTVTARG